MDIIDFRPEQIGTIATSIRDNLEKSIRNITEVHERSHVISINARIEAVRSGPSGISFRVVAEEFSRLNNEISLISHNLGKDIHTEVSRLLAVSDGMIKQVRGQRLAQIALSVMDVIDRNLYERSCDVRWWANDDSLVAAIIDPNEANCIKASKRLGVILDSYTVYLDIVLADNTGTVIANGRPHQFDSCGMSVSNSPWYLTAQGTSSENYSFQSTHKNSLVHGKSVLIYGCSIMSSEGKGSLKGCLGIIFNWAGLVEAVIGRVMRIDLHDDIERYKIPVAVSILDKSGLVLASSNSSLDGTVYPPDEFSKLIKGGAMGYILDNKNHGTRITAYGYSPGFETYSSGWYCVITEDLS